MTLICKHCKKEFWQSGNPRVYCSKECRSADTKQAKKKKMALKMSESHTKKMCRRYDCLYSAGQYQDYSCNYMIITDEKRGCAAGKGCIRYKKATDAERLKKLSISIRGY